MTGLAWYGINSADGNYRRYITVRTKKTKETNKVPSSITDDEICRQLENVRIQKLRTPEAFTEHSVNPSMSSSLWTDKYSPTDFLDLLTDCVCFYLFTF